MQMWKESYGECIWAEDTMRREQAADRCWREEGRMDREIAFSQGGQNGLPEIH